MTQDSEFAKTLWKFLYWEWLERGQCVSDRVQSHSNISLLARNMAAKATPTLAIAAALEKLGYDGVYHMSKVIQNPPDAWMWIDAYKGEMGKRPKFTRKDWDHLLGDVQCAIDVPSVGVLPALIAAYPAAKVVVCERNVDSWWASMSATVLQNRDRPLNLLLWLLDTEFYRPFVTLQMTMAPLVFGPKGLEEHNAKAVYKEKYAEVRRLVPEERRLEYKLEDGWKPLCRFFGKEIPDEPFPYINEGKEFWERVALMRQLAMKRIVKKYGPILLAVGFAILGITFIGSPVEGMGWRSSLALH